MVAGRWRGFASQLLNRGRSGGCKVDPMAALAAPEWSLSLTGKLQSFFEAFSSILSLIVLTTNTSFSLHCNGIQGVSSVFCYFALVRWDSLDGTVYFPTHHPDQVFFSHCASPSIKRHIAVSTILLCRSTSGREAASIQFRCSMGGNREGIMEGW